MASTLVVSALALGIAGCGSSGSATHATTQAKVKLTAAQVSSLTAALAAGRMPSTWQAGGPAFNATSLKGKKLFLLTEGSQQGNVSFATGVTAAARAAGLTVSTGNSALSNTQDVQLLAPVFHGIPGGVAVAEAGG